MICSQLTLRKKQIESCVCLQRLSAYSRHRHGQIIQRSVHPTGRQSATARTSRVPTSNNVEIYGQIVSEGSFSSPSSPSRTPVQRLAYPLVSPLSSVEKRAREPATSGSLSWLDVSFSQGLVVCIEYWYCARERGRSCTRVSCTSTGWTAECIL